MGNQTNRTQASQPSSRHYMDQIICQIPESRSLQFQVFLYHRRKINPLKNVVTIGGAKTITRNSLSKLQRPLVKVYIEKVMLRLSQAEINISQANYILKQSLNGFINLVRYYGRAFIVHEDLIFINESHEIKVWLNSNLAQNYIDENLSQPVSQIEMFADLINCISSKIALEQDRDMFMQIAKIAEQQVGLYYGQNLQKFNKNYLDNVYKALLKNENAKLKLDGSAYESQTNYNNTKQFRSYAISHQHSPEMRSPKRYFQEQEGQNTQRDYFENHTLARVKKSLDILNRNHRQPDQEQQIIFETQRLPASSDRKLLQQLFEFKGNLNNLQKNGGEVNPQTQSRDTLIKKPKSISAQKTMTNKYYKQYLSTHIQTQNTPKITSSKQNSIRSFQADSLKKVEETNSFNRNDRIQKTPKKNNKILPLFIKQRQRNIEGEKISQFNITQKTNKISEKSSDEQSQPVVSKKAKYAIKLQIQAPDKDIIPKIQISFQKSPRIKPASSKNSSRKTSNLSSAIANEAKTRFKTYQSDTQNYNQRQRVVSNKNNIQPIDEMVQHRTSNDYNQLLPTTSYEKKYFQKKQIRPYLKSQESDSANFKFQISSPSEFEQQRFNEDKKHGEKFFRKNITRNKYRDQSDIAEMYQNIIKQNKLGGPEPQQTKNNASFLNYSNSSVHNESYYRQLTGNYSKHLQTYSDNVYKNYRQELKERQ